MWGQHYSNLLNSSSDVSVKHDVMNVLSNVTYSEDTKVSVSEITDAIKNAKTGKSPDHQGIYSEHFKYADNRIAVLLSFLFTAIFVHGYIPEQFMISILVPIVKNKTGYYCK